MGTATLKIYDTYIAWSVTDTGDLGSELLRWKKLFLTGALCSDNDIGLVFYEGDMISYDNDAVLYYD